MHIEIPPLEKPGRYALKFDLVSEGIDWFGGVRFGYTTTRALVRCYAYRLATRSTSAMTRSKLPLHSFEICSSV